MQTKLLVSLAIMIPLAGTLVNFVPPPGANSLATHQKNVPAPLQAQLQKSRNLFHAGNFNEAAAIARKGYSESMRAGQQQMAAFFLGNLGICQFGLRQYREALSTDLKARALAETAGDPATAAKLDINISMLYAHLGQIDAARHVMAAATARLQGTSRQTVLPTLLIRMGELEAGQGHVTQAADFFRQGIAAARDHSTPEDYAIGLNNLGYLYLEHDQPRQAEPALLEAYRVRKLNHLRSVESSYRNLGMLSLAQGDAAAASALLDRAVALSRQPGGMRPAWDVYYARGRVRMEQNRLPEALDDLRIAARLARSWRRSAFPDDATRVSAENKVQKVHSALVVAGNRLYFAGGPRALAQETFESAEANRASSRRPLLAEPRDWRRNLPGEYWETLQKLESAEAELLQAKSAARPAAERVYQLQGALIQWESRAGSGSDTELPDLLERTRRRLRPDAAFLTFHLAPAESYLWAVSREGFSLYRLPPAEQIDGLVKNFNQALRRDDASATMLGAKLFRALFGQLEPAFLHKSRWLLALDAELFKLPFGALVEARGPAGPVYLAERHALEITSGAAMLSPAEASSGSPGGPFMAVADAVYNTADPRWSGAKNSPLGFFAARAEERLGAEGLQLARLPGSAREAKECAYAWGGSWPPILLEGPAASRRRIEQALTRKPGVLHFATHVVSPREGSRSGLIVLSLAEDGKREVLSDTEIATWNLEGTLVALSGCSSSTAETLPATGLMGLTRACQAAGASAVIASLWPTPDDAGALFLAFYQNLHTAPQDGPAAAIQRAQIEMLRSGTWRSNPLYWGAYFVMGNRQ